MQDFVFEISPNIVLGSYAINKLARYLKEYGSRFMIVMDPVLKDVNVAEIIFKPLQENKIDFFVYDEISDGANTKEIEHALSLAKKGYIHGIIGAGGAKALNTATAAAALFYEKGSIYEYTDGNTITAKSLPLINIPTTIRAPYAFTTLLPVIDSRTYKIKLLNMQKTVSKLVLWDPNLSLTLTDNQTASIALESLCIAAEAYLSPKASFFSDMFSEKAAELMGYALNISNLQEVVTPAENYLMQAGCAASLAAASSSQGTANLLALTVSTRCKISKALVAAILFPYIIEDAGKFKTARVEKFAHLTGCVSKDIKQEEAVHLFAESIRQQLVKANLPLRLKELSLSLEQLATAAEDAGELDIVNSLPRSMTSDMLFDLLKSAY